MSRMTTIKRQVEDAARHAGDDPSAMICFIRRQIGGERWSEQWGPVERCTFAELPSREFDAGYGGHEGEPFIGFTDRYVYVCGQYDGSEWIDPVPRSPEGVKGPDDIPIIGG